MHFTLYFLIWITWHILKRELLKLKFIAKLPVSLYFLIYCQYSKLLSFT